MIRKSSKVAAYREKNHQLRDFFETVLMKTTLELKAEKKMMDYFSLEYAFPLPALRVSMSRQYCCMYIMLLMLYCQSGWNREYKLAPFMGWVLFILYLIIHLEMEDKSNG